MKRSEKSEKKKTKKRVVICGSMSFYADMQRQSRLLRREGVTCVVPKPDSSLSRNTGEENMLEAKRRASMQHIRKVRDTKTFGVLIVNPDKHGIPHYIGPNTFAEIAVALAHYKRIYLYQAMPEFYREELQAWGVTCLNGSLRELIDDFRREDLVRIVQPTLFDLDDY